MASVSALVEDRTRAIVKFRYHGNPRVKCSNCRLGGTNYAPALIGDGVACVQEVEPAVWDCEVPEAVRRFRVARNGTELVVLADRAALVDAPPEQSKGWSFGVQYALWGVVLASWRFLLQFIRGPVSGQLTAWWLRGKEKKRS